MLVIKETFQIPMLFSQFVFWAFKHEKINQQV